LQKKKPCVSQTDSKIKDISVALRDDADSEDHYLEPLLIIDTWSAPKVRENTVASLYR
jgi:hypothetical protein